MVLKNFSEIPLDKPGWLHYIECREECIGVMLNLKAAYEDLKNSFKLERNERYFVLAWEEYVKGKE